MTASEGMLPAKGRFEPKGMWAVSGALASNGVLAAYGMRPVEGMLATAGLQPWNGTPSWNGMPSRNGTPSSSPRRLANIAAASCVALCCTVSHTRFRGLLPMPRLLLMRRLHTLDTVVVKRARTSPSLTRSQSDTVAAGVGGSSGRGGGSGAPGSIRCRATSARERKRAPDWSK